MEEAAAQDGRCPSTRRRSISPRRFGTSSSSKNLCTTSSTAHRQARADEDPRSRAFISTPRRSCTPSSCTKSPSLFHSPSSSFFHHSRRPSYRSSRPSRTSRACMASRCTPQRRCHPFSSRSSSNISGSQQQPSASTAPRCRWRSSACRHRSRRTVSPRCWRLGSCWTTCRFVRAPDPSTSSCRAYASTATGTSASHRAHCRAFYSSTDRARHSRQGAFRFLPQRSDCTSCPSSDSQDGRIYHSRSSEGIVQGPRGLSVRGSHVAHQRRHERSCAAA